MDQPESKLNASTSGHTATNRVLACVRCQQRKVRCDRKQPCTNCVKSGIESHCIPSKPLPLAQRRRRFPERELLERLRRYEDLLRDNNIDFHPLHSSTATSTTKQDSSSHGNPGSSLSMPVRSGSEEVTERLETLNIWQAMNQDLHDSENGDEEAEDEDDQAIGVRYSSIQQALDQEFASNDHFLFGLRQTSIQLIALHPDQIQIFRLWQIYIDNVNPLLRVTHIPTLQPQLINAAGNLAGINPSLEALMFSIYCVSIASLSDDNCSAIFGSSKMDLLPGYWLGCQQALLAADVSKTTHRDCLTALYLYLISIRSNADPRSLCPMTGVAIRVAQRMGIDSESMNAKQDALEGEMRRRLWWSLAVFDKRVCEKAVSKGTSLIPTWDCKLPLNINDFDLRPEMKSPPKANDGPTEAFFIVAYSELHDCIRHNVLHLEFINPALKLLAKASSPDFGANVEEMMEKKYLSLGDPDNPLHFMTMWMIRAQVAKIRMFEYYVEQWKAKAPLPTVKRDIALFNALKMLECDCKLLNSPLTKCYSWLVEFHFPFPALIHVMQDLRRRPFEAHSERAWGTLSDSYFARKMHLEGFDNPLYKLVSKNILRSWEAREAELGGRLDVAPPIMVDDIRSKLSQLESDSRSSISTTEPSEKFVSLSVDHNYGKDLPTEFGEFDTSMSAPTGPALALPGSIPAQLSTPDFRLDQVDWNTMDWNPFNAWDW